MNNRFIIFWPPVGENLSVSHYRFWTSESKYLYYLFQFDIRSPPACSNTTPKVGEEGIKKNLNQWCNFKLTQKGEKALFVMDMSAADINFSQSVQKLWPEHHSIPKFIR